MSLPSYIFIVRHGNRLDAADKQWHLSSPTPYDPPLTYSGWTQSRAVGAKISSILSDRASEEDASNPCLARRKKKRYRIVVHTSPFLRCIQTSVAISAGLLSRPSIIADARRTLSPAQAQDAASADGSVKWRRTSTAGKKVVLRIDAFLGEWLSPGYFELITPPPGSVMMLASAKASLLKVENYNSYPHFQHRAHSNSTASPPSPHLWGGPVQRPGPPSPPSTQTPGSLEDLADPSSSALEDLVDVEQSLPRTSSRASALSEMSRRASVATSAAPPETGAYEPPVPAFSVSSNAPIPAGYVNHSKDNCVLVDYQWDSMRAPYDWGDGGELPEDWPDMHKRIRKGLQAMIDWYGATEDPATAVTTEFVKPAASGGSDGRKGDDDDDEEYETETVVILVSHGAGCNAMIGGITHRPVLMDVPLSSVTMAVRKPDGKLQPGLNGGRAPSPYGSRPMVTKTPSIPIHQLYDVKMFANTEHLRSPTTTPSSSRSSSVANVFSARGRNSNSFSSGFSNPLASDGIANRSSSVNSSPGALGSFRKSLQNSAASRSTTFTPSGLSRSPSVGLWSPTAKQDEVCIEDDDDYDMILEFSRDKPRPSDRATASVSNAPTFASPEPANGKEEEPSQSNSLPTLSEETDKRDSLLPGHSPRANGIDGARVGLWTGKVSSPATAGSQVIRDLSSSKRRWTLGEQA